MMYLVKPFDAVSLFSFRLFSDSELNNFRSEFVLMFVLWKIQWPSFSVPPPLREMTFFLTCSYKTGLTELN